MYFPGQLPVRSYWLRNVYGAAAVAAADGPTREAITRAKAGDGGASSRLDEFLGRAGAAVRAVYRGPLTYASLIWEDVDSLSPWNHSRNPGVRPPDTHRDHDHSA